MSSYYQSEYRPSVDPFRTDHEIKRRKLEIFVERFGLEEREAARLAVINRMFPMQMLCDEYRMVSYYFDNSNAHNLNIQVVGLWKVYRRSDERLFRLRGYHWDNAMFLWHGTRRETLAHILQTGLKRSHHKEMSLYMYGRGLYFSDRVSQSANYCDPTPENPYGVLFLSKVAVGNMCSTYRARQHEHTHDAAHVCDCLRGMGKRIPDLLDNLWFDGALVPWGITINNPDPFALNSDLLYNDYCVYTTRRLLLRYVLVFQKIF